MGVNGGMGGLLLAGLFGLGGLWYRGAVHWELELVWCGLVLGCNGRLVQWGCVANGMIGWWGGACGMNRLAAVIVDGRCRKSSLP